MRGENTASAVKLSFEIQVLLKKLDWMKLLLKFGWPGVNAQFISDMKDALKKDFVNFIDNFQYFYLCFGYFFKVGVGERKVSNNYARATH